MARHLLAVSLLSALTGSIFAGDVDARNRLYQDTNSYTLIAEASPTLAPFQHVRFCLHYPSDCKSNPMEDERIDLNVENLELLRRVNGSVNTAITPKLKNYGPDLQEGWTIAPASGDCNDYAITKRHALLESGLPAKALRLSTVTTASGIGHLVLVVATTKGDMVLDNLTESIRPWQNTEYRWLKIQSASDARFWNEIRTPGAMAQSGRSVRLADR
jgi:predicted transglutaminase-like cysteine proteinase